MTQTNSALPSHLTANLGEAFNLPELAKRFPETATTMMVDMYLKDTPESSIRLFRVYHEVKPHYHTQCDEVLYVLSGEGVMWIGTEENRIPFAPGALIVFPRNTVHAIPEFSKEPVIFFTVDAPRRDRNDVIFVDPSHGTAENFMGSV